MIYVKEYIHYRRRRDLKPRGIECIWIEIANNTKHALFGVYYRPPNSDSTYYTSIEDSLHLARDTGINDVIITGDFNFNLLHQQRLYAKLIHYVINLRCFKPSTNPPIILRIHPHYWTSYLSYLNH